MDNQPPTPGRKIEAARYRRRWPAQYTGAFYSIELEAI